MRPGPSVRRLARPRRFSRHEIVALACELLAWAAVLAVLPGETLTAALIADLAGEMITLDKRVRDTDELIEDRLHRHAPVITSMPGIGTVLGAEFLAATGGGITWLATADRLAAFAELASAR